MKHESLPEWRDDHYHRAIEREGFGYTGQREIGNAFSFMNHPDQSKQYKVRAIHTYVKRIQNQGENTPQHARSILQSLEKAIGRLERGLYPHRIRPIQVHLEMHPLSRIAEEQGQQHLQDFWQLTVHELEEVQRKRPRKN